MRLLGDFQTTCIVFKNYSRMSHFNFHAKNNIFNYFLAGNIEWFSMLESSTMFENYSKCRIWILTFWHFPPIFVISKVTCLITLFDHVNGPFLAFLINFLSTENVNVARFARNVECDFLAIFKHCEQAEVLKLGDFSRVHFRIPEGLPFKKQFYEAFSAGLTNVKSTLEFHSKEEEERSESKWKKSNFCFHFWLQNCRILKKRNIHSVLKSLKMSH